MPILEVIADVVKQSLCQYKIDKAALIWRPYTVLAFKGFLEEQSIIIGIYKYDGIEIQRKMNWTHS